VLVASGAALGVQWLAVQAAGPGLNGPASRRDLPVAYAVRVVASMLFGERWLDRLWLRLSVWLAVIAIVVLVVVIVAAAPRQIAVDRRWFAVMSAVLSVVLFTVPVWIRGTEIIRLTTGEFTGVGSRYVYLPLVILFSGVVVLIDGTSRRPLVALVAVQSAALMIVCLGLSSLRSPGPTWSSALAVARAQCREPNAPSSVKIPITPEGQGWLVAVPCGRLGDVSSPR
jgi:hypothetical protein